MIFEATTVGCVAQYNMLETAGPVVNDMNPGVHDLNNMGATPGLSTGGARFYKFTYGNGLAAVDTIALGDTFTIEVLASVSASTAANQNLIGDVDTNTGWSVRYNDSTLKFQFISETTGTPNISVSSTASATFGTSYHIMVTHDASAGANNSKIYLNGVLDNTATNPSSPVSGTVLKMGDIATGLMWLNNLTGLVYLVRIYNRVLSPNEVFQNFQASHWEIPHVKGTWAAAPSINAALTYAKIANLDNQWTDLGHDIGPVQATQIVATTTSRKQAGADFVCDGTADDVEIQAALDAANAVGGGTVMILDGTYNINAPINVYDNIILCGTGRGTILKSVNGGIEVPTATVIQNYDQNYGNSGIIIRDMTITGLSAADPLVYGIYLSACDEPPYVTISKVHFTGDTYYDIYLQACYHATIEGITGSGRGGVGQGSFLVYLNESAYCHVVNCQAYTENSIMFSNCSDCMVRSCSVTTHGGYAIEFANCDHCGAVGNEVAPDASGAPAVGIEDLNGVQNLIVANVVYKGTVAGINMDGTAQGDVIVGNSVNGCTGWGIGYGGGAGYANISYNNIIGTSKEAIRATAAPASVALYGAVVNGNVCYANNLNGLVLSCGQSCVLNYNVCSQCGSSQSQLAIYAEGTAYPASENICVGNLCYRGDSPPATVNGLYIGTTCANNMVTMNYLYLSNNGAGVTLSDVGTGTDKTGWMAAGNKIA